jgi:hypothetical protein
MEKADHFRAVVRQGLHEPALVSGHADPAAFKDGGDVVMETETHLGEKQKVESRKQKSKHDSQLSTLNYQLLSIDH